MGRALERVAGERAPLTSIVGERTLLLPVVDEGISLSPVPVGATELSSTLTAGSPGAMGKPFPVGRDWAIVEPPSEEAGCPEPMAVATALGVAPRIGSSVLVDARKPEKTGPSWSTDVCASCVVVSIALCPGSVGLTWLKLGGFAWLELEELAWSESDEAGS